ncbi:hypothetical protein QJR26_18545 (plasmid) [Clostridium baratii]
MKEIILSNIDLSVYSLIREILLIAVAVTALFFILMIMLTDRFESKYRFVIKSVLILVIIGTYISFLIYIDHKDNAERMKIVSSYNIEKTDDYIIDNKQYEKIVNSIKDEELKIIDVFKKKADKKIEKLCLNVPDKLIDNSKGDSNEKIIKVTTYKNSLDKKYLFLDCPEEIKVIEEIQ